MTDAEDLRPVFCVLEEDDSLVSRVDVYWGVKCVTSLSLCPPRPRADIEAAWTKIEAQVKAHAARARAEANEQIPEEEK